MSLATELLLEAIEADRAAERRAFRDVRRAEALFAPRSASRSSGWRRRFIRALPASRRDAASAAAARPRCV